MQYNQEAFRSYAFLGYEIPVTLLRGNNVVLVVFLRLFDKLRPLRRFMISFCDVIKKCLKWKREIKSNSFEKTIPQVRAAVGSQDC